MTFLDFIVNNIFVDHVINVTYLEQRKAAYNEVIVFWNVCYFCQMQRIYSNFIWMTASQFVEWPELCTFFTQIFVDRHTLLGQLSILDTKTTYPHVSLNRVYVYHSEISKKLSEELSQDRPGQPYD